LKLSVALLENHTLWEFWLRQIGVSFKSCDSLSPDYPVAIINSKLQPQDLAQFLNSGMNIIISTSQAKNWHFCNVTTRKVRWIHSDEEVFCNIRPFFLNLILSCPNDANALCDQHNNFLIKIEQVGNGRIIIIPDELIYAAAVYRSARIPFPTIQGHKSPTERVCITNKSGIREVFSHLLMWCFHRLDLPYAFIWPYPHAKESWFGFRIDTDFAAPEKVTALAQILEKAQIPATWFVETRSVEKDIGKYVFPPNHEVALHCYRHAIYDTVSENRADIQRGKSILQKAGYTPAGYAAPFGEWHPFLAKALAEEGLEYSSEFAVGYDNYPFFPLVDNTFSPVLQVPIHPISVGRLRWAKFTELEMIAYYCAVADLHYAQNLPIIFYHHPGQNRLSVWKAVFKHIKQNGSLHYSTLYEFSNWWKLRNNVSWEIIFQNNKIIVHTNEPNSTASIAVILPDASLQHLPLLSNQRDIFSSSRKKDKPAIFVSNLKMDYNKRRTLQTVIHDITWFRSRYRQRKQSE
jgi:peptidoglycan/xylan/chitin deacetylase (PgdA/CDA1 family)